MRSVMNWNPVSSEQGLDQLRLLTSNRSETTRVQIWDFEVDGRRIHLIDTPGFDDTNRSDTDVLKDLAYWLGLSYEKKKIRLTGLIYLHPISHTRMAGTAFKNLRTFKKMVGSQSMRSVALVSTMWDERSGPEEERRDQMLRETPEFWKDIIAEGAKPHRHGRTRDNAVAIVKSLLPNEPTVLSLQNELVNQGKELNRTEAGKEVDAGISLQRELLERKIEQTKADMTEALAAKDQKWVEQVAADQAKYEQQVQSTKTAQEEMKLSMEKIFAEREEQYKKSIQEMDEKVKDLEDQHLAREEQFHAEQEAARKRQELQNKRIAEQEQEVANAQGEVLEARLENFFHRLNIELERRGVSEDETKQRYEETVAQAKAQMEMQKLLIEKEKREVEQMREREQRRQLEHLMAMRQGPPPPYPWPNQAPPESSPPMWQQQQAMQQQAMQQQQMYDAQMATVGGAVAGAGLGLAAASATLCTIM